MSDATDLEALSERAMSGPWAYRPWTLDDWGYIRAADGQVACVSRGGEASTYDAHRKAGSDPFEKTGRFIVALVNAFRDGSLVPASRLREVERERDEARRVHRWNVDENGDGTLSICRGGHDKADGCEWETFVPIERLEAFALRPTPSEAPAASGVTDEQIARLLMMEWIVESGGRHSTTAPRSKTSACIRRMTPPPACGSLQSYDPPSPRARRTGEGVHRASSLLGL